MAYDLKALDAALAKRIEEKKLPGVTVCLRGPEGVISLDFRGKKPGRGAYVCPEKACFDRIKKSKALERAFECPIPDEIYENLYAELDTMEEEPVE